ncbi:hypothetical protein WR25_14017 isoform A [Diploscapter pachys]|uniref:TFIIS N-terminal domain-containing protein n=1 Tax=Diploscapter pachys TaxID=2018661 RepID=A0A2A2KVX2_9BILA|nr:hypothetical protein WR25_14017 isoform A [Diploscapter pachys]
MTFSPQDPMESSVDTYIDKINLALSSLKYKYEREDALTLLEKVPMTFDRLVATEAGKKITQMFRSSRFAERAAALHEKWMQIVDAELQKKWPELKRMFFTGPQVRELDRLQRKFEREHPEFVAPVDGIQASSQLTISSRRNTAGIDDFMASSSSSSMMPLRLLEKSMSDDVSPSADRRTPNVYDNEQWYSAAGLHTPSLPIGGSLDEEQMLEYMDEDEIEEYKIKMANSKPIRKRGRPKKSTSVAAPANQGNRSIFDRTDEKPTKRDPDFKPGYYYVRRGRGRGRGSTKKS